MTNSTKLINPVSYASTAFNAEAIVRENQLNKIEKYFILIKKARCKPSIKSANN
jgi:hypothetical protein